MRRAIPAFCVAASSALVLAGASSSGSRQSTVVLRTGPLVTAVTDPTLFSDGATAGVPFDRVRGAGATVVRLWLRWEEVAPGVRKPAPFDPTDPADPAYHWQRYDGLIKTAVEHGLTPLVTIADPPRWARGPGDNERPNAAEYGAFARATALRYSGRFEDLPRVSYWHAWNEPNVNIFLSPQSIAVSRYREMVNAFAQGVHSVDARNLVVAGGLSPFTVRSGETKTIGPLKFMRELLCMSAGANPRPACNQRIEFDVWSHHPYTTGGPVHEAADPDDVSLGDLGEMRTLLVAAARAGRISSRGALRFWVTEFSWDTAPPDPRAVPLALQARWIAEGLHTMWKAGVTLVTWWKLRDDPLASSPFQSGLYRRGSSLASDRAKPSLTAFRFPFTAHAANGRVAVWGRTPGGRPGNVLLERKGATGGWTRVAVAHADSAGIFRATIRSTATTGFMRARFAGTSSLAFSLREEPDRFYRPFG